MSKTNLGLVEYCKSKLTLPTIYFLSGFGRVLTEVAIAKRIANGDTFTARYATKTRSGIGKFAFDCGGLIKGYLWETSPGVVPYKLIDGVYVAGSDQNAKGMYDSSVEKGPFASMPDIIGLLVFTADLGHVGVYVGKVNGVPQYIEATPAWEAWGVTTSAQSGHPQNHNRQWTYYGKHHLITYIVPPPVVTPVTTLKVGDIVRITGTNYSTGQVIPDSVKLRTHTIMQVATTKVLLKEIYSWVNITDVVLTTVSIPVTKEIMPGSVIKFKYPNSPYTRYSNQTIIPLWVKRRTHVVARRDSSRALLVAAFDVNTSQITDKGIFSWVFLKDIEVV